MRAQILKSLLNFWTQNNSCHKKASVQKDLEALGRFINDKKSTSRIVEFQEIIVGNDQDNSDNVSDPETVEIRNSENLTTERMTLSISEPSRCTVKSNEYASMKLVDVKRHGQTIPDKVKDYFARFFPDLFPYGERHSGSERRINVSLKECCSYYLQLPSRNFSNHSLFTLRAFDKISRE